MSRCVLAFTVAAAAFLTTAPLVASAQLPRSFPRQALRGEITFGTPPAVLLNGDTAQLAPGVRIRGLNNMIVMSSALVGQKVKVNYTIDTYSLIKDVWILRKDEIANLWPKTAEEAATWSFDEIGQTWTKP